MLAELRDWLRARPALAGVDLAMRGDSTGAPLPRARLWLVDDPREHDLDGAANFRDPRVQIDVYAGKAQLARLWAERIEQELAALAGETLGDLRVQDVEVNGVPDAPPEPEESGRADAVNRVVVDVALRMQKT